MLGKAIKTINTYFNQFIDINNKGMYCLGISNSGNNVEFRMNIQGMMVSYIIPEEQLTFEGEIYVNYEEWYQFTRISKMKTELTLTLSDDSQLTINISTPGKKVADAPEVVEKIFNIKEYKRVFQEFSPLTSLDSYDFANILTIHNSACREYHMPMTSGLFLDITKGFIESVNINLTTMVYNEMPCNTIVEDRLFIPNEILGKVSSFMSYEPSSKGLVGVLDEIKISKLNEWYKFSKGYANLYVKIKSDDAKNFTELKKMILEYSAIEEQEVSEDLVEELREKCETAKLHGRNEITLEYSGSSVRYSRMNWKGLQLLFGYVDNLKCRTMKNDGILFWYKDNQYKHYYLMTGTSEDTIQEDIEEDGEMLRDEDEDTFDIIDD